MNAAWICLGCGVFLCFCGVMLDFHSKQGFARAMGSLLCGTALCLVSLYVIQSQ